MDSKTEDQIKDISIIIRNIRDLHIVEINEIQLSNLTREQLYIIIKTYEGSYNYLINFLEYHI
jgi:hypothetical protein